MQAVPVGFVPSAPCVGPVEQLIDMGWTIRLLHIVAYVKAHSVADEPSRPIGFMMYMGVINLDSLTASQMLCGSCQSHSRSSCRASPLRPGSGLRTAGG